LYGSLPYDFYPCFIWTKVCTIPSSLYYEWTQIVHLIVVTKVYQAYYLQ